MTDANAGLQKAVDPLLPSEAELRILEAGCGSASHLRLSKNWWLVGIDISQRQLALNTRLNEKVVGDLQSHAWQPRSFDLVVCWDVLEHLQAPRAALARLFPAVKEGGLLILAMPHPGSLKGLVTRLTPFGFHAWFYRHVIGDKRAREQLDQFPTYMHRDTHPKRVIDFASRNGFSVAYTDFYEGPVQRHLRNRSRFANAAFSVLRQAARLTTFGAYDPTLSDCILLLRRNALARGDEEAAKP